MNYDFYAEIKIEPDSSTFEFVSEGRNGHILKRIKFTPTHWPNIYNLAFGDVTKNEEIDDIKISGNGIFAGIKGKDEFVLFQKGLNINAFLVRRKFVKFAI